MKRLEKQVISALKEGDKTIWDLFVELDCTEKQLVMTLNELHAQGVIKGGEKISLLKDISLRPRKSNKCPTCGGRWVHLGDEGKKLLERFKELTSDLFPEEDKWQQARILPEESIYKITLMREREDLEDAKLLIVGDDDFIGVGSCLTGLPKEVVILDIDERILKKTNELANEFNWPLEARRYDVRDPLPDDLKNRFDTMVTDPPEAYQAMKVFVSRAVEGLKEKGDAGYVGLTHMESDVGKWQKIEKDWLDMGFAITDVLRQFTTYPEGKGEWERAYADYPLIKNLSFKVNKPNRDWYTATLFRLELIGKPNPPITGKIEMGSEFYFDEETWSVPESYKGFSASSLEKS